MLLFGIYNFGLLLLQWNENIVLHNHINNEALTFVSFRLLAQSNVEPYDETNLENPFVLDAEENDNKLGSHITSIGPEVNVNSRVYKSIGNKDAHNKLKNDNISKKKNNDELNYEIKKGELIKEDPLNDKNEDGKILDKEEKNRQIVNNLKSDYLNSNEQLQKKYIEEIKLFDEETEDIPKALNDLLDDKIENLKLLMKEMLTRELQLIKERLHMCLKTDIKKCGLIKSKLLENQIEKANILRDKLLEDKYICTKMKIEDINSMKSLENSINNMGIRDRTKLKIKKHIKNYMDSDDSFEQVNIYNKIKKYITNDINPGIFRKIMHTLKIQEGVDSIGKSKLYHRITHNPLLLYIRRYVIFDLIVFIGTSQLMESAIVAIPITVVLLIILFFVVKFKSNITELFQKKKEKKKEKKKKR
ncbi:Plasmodium exported protein, unknown function [Plasmodium berghei]|uniref:Uncharacterized protein n=2 Tax=Plasmodium berghei TaxID=5821 RepID=A0A509ALU9_PLABA|nr:Plasmodium exported protein, unknown function [Plasmodium berghei ANKA]CXI58991.1 Plasmodium exported protein, unknown function [Plasmodium berghei]SCM23405.1 Plasmodium exported protein, unknown function [Plasmodium berghei]SCN26575.1 Plasmodium exported protein, unknown function [Plasmodium berghei]SCO60838.1 Plasmodium exported protein, unknown function [Plasmodium berghei]SCO62817.1 Plasmodium exported protein, unknown function [Plasmodium berghei]|eukprot:XP_034422220.1 Plasmodium exported protein, unknown function [Plasmodium berghei ANKA]